MGDDSRYVSYLLYGSTLITLLVYNVLVVSLQLIFDVQMYESYRQLVLFDILFSVLSLLMLVYISDNDCSRKVSLYFIYMQFIFVLMEITVFFKEQLIFKLVYIYWLKFAFVLIIPLAFLVVLKV